MALNTRLLWAKHPRFDSAAYSALSIFTNSIVEIRPPQTEREDWDPLTGFTPKEHAPVWRGWAAVTPNKDWRARNRRHSYDDTAVHSYRVQLHHIDQNLLVPRTQWGDRSKRIVPTHGWFVKVVQHETATQHNGLSLVVRVATRDSDWWQPTLLCDIDAGDENGKADRT